MEIFETKKGVKGIHLGNSCYITFDKLVESRMEFIRNFSEIDLIIQSVSPENDTSTKSRHFFEKRLFIQSTMCPVRPFSRKIKELSI